MKRALTGADPKFEIRVTSHLAGADFGYGVPKGPFESPETGLGVPKGPKESQGSKGSLSRRDAVAKLPSGVNVRVFQGPLDRSLDSKIKTRFYAGRALQLETGFNCPEVVLILTMKDMSSWA